MDDDDPDPEPPPPLRGELPAPARAQVLGTGRRRESRPGLDVLGGISAIARVATWNFEAMEVLVVGGLALAGTLGLMAQSTATPAGMHSLLTDALFCAVSLVGPGIALISARLRFRVLRRTNGFELRRPRAIFAAPVVSAAVLAFVTNATWVDSTIPTKVSLAALGMSTLASILIPTRIALTSFGLRFWARTWPWSVACLRPTKDGYALALQVGAHVVRIRVEDAPSLARFVEQLDVADGPPRGF